MNKEANSSEDCFPMYCTLNRKASIYDDENYDDEEETPAKVNNPEGDTSESTSALAADQKQVEFLEVDSCPDGGSDSDTSTQPLQPTKREEKFSVIDITEDKAKELIFLLQKKPGPVFRVSLPVSYVEDGMAIPRYSKFLETYKLRKKERSKKRLPCDTTIEGTVEAYDVEDDEADFLRNSIENVTCIQYLTLLEDGHQQVKDRDYKFPVRTNEFSKDSCMSGQPMKNGIDFNLSTGCDSHVCTAIYPLDMQDWEDEIIWGNSPCSEGRPTEGAVLTESDNGEKSNVDGKLGDRSKIKSNSKVVSEFVDEEKPHSSDPDVCSFVQHKKRSYHPQMLRLENVKGLEPALVSTETSDISKKSCRGGLHKFSKFSQNEDLLNDSWLDRIIWNPDESILKTRLILCQETDKMLSDDLGRNEEGHLSFNTSASLNDILQKPSPTDVEARNNSFHISNDNYYSLSKSSQQSKSHGRKPTSYGLKIMHSIPALKLQNMKPMPGNREIANFHRPKALWSPHQNKVAEKLLGKFCNKGSFRIILRTLPGRLTLLRAEATELVSALVIKASKKLDFYFTTGVKLFHNGRELETGKSLAEQSVECNSILHLVHSSIELLPRADNLPCDNKSLRPPGAFKKKADLSVKDGHIFLVEYCEERPLLLGNVGMGAQLCTYYQKASSPRPETIPSFPNGSNGLGTIIALDPSDRSPFLGEINPGCCQSSLETNMYRSPIFHHNLASTDFLLVRSANGALSLRRINKIFAAGQQEPHMEVMPPGTKSAQTFLGNRFLAYVYSEFRAKSKCEPPYVLAEELSSCFPTLSESSLRKRLKHCADLQRSQEGHLIWALNNSFRLPSEEEVRRMVTPEDVCLHESMLAGHHRLKCQGIKHLTAPIGLSAAMDRLPNETIALVTASYIDQELQITPWNLSNNFVSCKSKEKVERMEITGIGDPSGHGLGFSYVCAASKAAGAISLMEKTSAAREATAMVAGTDVDLHDLSMDATRVVLLKFNVPEELIGKMTRWHRIATIDRLVAKQDAFGIKMDATSLSKYTRSQRIPYVQLQQQARQKCQEIWDRQIQSLCAADAHIDRNDSEADCNFDSFVGDLENMLDTEEHEDCKENKFQLDNDRTEGVKGLKMRRAPSQAQTKEEIQEDEVEAASICKLLQGFESKIKKKPKKKRSDNELSLGSGCAEDISMSTKTFIPTKEKGNEENNVVATGATKIRIKTTNNVLKLVKDKKPYDKPVRENFLCGACGQSGHMKTNKHCPKYKKGLDSSQLKTGSIKSHVPEVAIFQSTKKLDQKSTASESTVLFPRSPEKTALKSPAKDHSFKVKCGFSDQHFDKNSQVVQSSLNQNPPQISNAEGSKPASRLNRIIVSSKKKVGSDQQKVQKPSLVIRLPASLLADKDQARRKDILKRSKSVPHMEQVGESCSVKTDQDSGKMIAEFSAEGSMQDQWIAEEMIPSRPTQSMSVWEKEKKNNRLKTDKERSFLDLGLEMEHKKLKKENKRLDFKDGYLEYGLSGMSNLPERGRAAKLRPFLDLGQHSADYGPPTKRIKRGEVL